MKGKCLLTRGEIFLEDILEVNLLIVLPQHTAQVHLGIELDLERGMQVICAKVELDVGILVPDDALGVVEDGIGESRVERLIVDAL